MQSESIDLLATALSKAQAVMEGASKDSTNPFFKSKYTSLTSVWEAIKGPLTSNGLSVAQVTGITDDGHCYLITRLLHCSGQWIEGRMPILTKDDSAQGFGAGLTYAKRQALQAIVGVCAEDDDDGQRASARPAATQAQPARSNTTPIREPAKSAGTVQRPLPPAQSSLNPEGW